MPVVQLVPSQLPACDGTRARGGALARPAGRSRNTVFLGRTLLSWVLLLVAAVVQAEDFGTDVTLQISRQSQYKLTDEQTLVLDEASKISAACRVFHGLYGRWPEDLLEIEQRTTGIDLTVFRGKVMVEEVPEGMLITVFDGIDVRKLLATRDSPASAEMQARAKDPRFKIRIALEKVVTKPDVGLFMPDSSFQPNVEAGGE